jgi:uncharacterized phage-associated protein
MPIDGRAAANFILDRFDSRQYSISNKKINKLLFISQGFVLIRLGEPLIRNHFEAWKHGPVVRVVYEAFHQFEYRPIQGRAHFFDYVTGKDEIVPYDGLSPDEADLVEQVVGHFAPFGADELGDWTHREDSPWWRVRNQTTQERGLRDRIPNALIEEYFSLIYGRGKTH